MSTGAEYVDALYEVGVALEKASRCASDLGRGGEESILAGMAAVVDNVVYALPIDVEEGHGERSHCDDCGGLTLRHPDDPTTCQVCGTPYQGGES